jgi:ABC-2 type transport system permease protein
VTTPRSVTSRSVTPRSLPLGAEIRRHLSRRRTLVVFAVLVALPLVLVAAFAVGGTDTGPQQRGFVDLAQDSGANLVVFALFASTGFLLVVVVALFAGDPVPSEASWSSLRYLLTAPVRRERLLRQKLVAAGLYTLVALVFLPAWTLLVGGTAYGWGPYVGPTGDQLAYPLLLGRLVVVVAYLFVSLAVVGAFAFLLGTATDAPLAAVGGGVVLWIVCAILDQISALGGLRQALPGHFAFAWSDALAPTVDWSSMAQGALWSTGYAVLLVGIAVWRFLRRDIIS